MKYVVFVISLFYRIGVFLDPDGKYVCSRKATSEANGTIIDHDYLIHECCPDYFERDGECRECSPGRFGRNCENTCLAGKYGPMCSNTCNCNQHQHCDSVHGCVCNSGYSGPQCSPICPTGFYGVNCQMCICARRATCDPKTGQCYCPVGWTGRYCMEQCGKDRFGENCSQVCECRNGIGCDPVNGSCFDGVQKKNKSVNCDGNTVIIYKATMYGLLVVLLAIIVVLLVRYRIRKGTAPLTEDGYNEIYHYNEMSRDNQAVASVEQGGRWLPTCNIQSRLNRTLSLPNMYSPDGYLHPYTPLIANRGDYLNPYSALHIQMQGNIENFL